MTIEIAHPDTWVQVNYNTANLSCLFLEIDGKKGWRLPTMEEADLIEEVSIQYDDFGKEALEWFRPNVVTTGDTLAAFYEFWFPMRVTNYSPEFWTSEAADHEHLDDDIACMIAVRDV